MKDTLNEAVRRVESEPDRWRRVHAEKHAAGLRFGGSKTPWPKCPICQQEVDRGA